MLGYQQASFNGLLDHFYTHSWSPLQEHKCMNGNLNNGQVGNNLITYLTPVRGKVHAYSGFDPLHGWCTLKFEVVQIVFQVIDLYDGISDLGTIGNDGHPLRFWEFPVRNTQILVGVILFHVQGPNG